MNFGKLPKEGSFPIQKIMLQIFAIINGNLPRISGKKTMSGGRGSFPIHFFWISESYPKWARGGVQRQFGVSLKIHPSLNRLKVWSFARSFLEKITVTFLPEMWLRRDKNDILPWIQRWCDFARWEFVWPAVGWRPSRANSLRPCSPGASLGCSKTLLKYHQDDLMLTTTTRTLISLNDTCGNHSLGGCVRKICENVVIV